MKLKRSKVFLLAAILVVNGLLVIDSGSARPMLAEEYVDAELEIGMKVREGDKIFAPEWFANYVNMMIRYTDENGRLLDTKFGIWNAKSYTIPSYLEIWGNTAIPEGKVFDCWEVVKKPEKQPYQIIWELRRVLRDAVSEEPMPSEEVGPSEKPEPSEEVRPSEKPELSEEVRPSEEPEPSDGVKPSEEVKPSEAVKSSKAPVSSEEVKPSKAPHPSEAVDPGKVPDSNETVKPNKPVNSNGTVDSNTQLIQTTKTEHTFFSKMDVASVQTPALLQTAALHRNQQPADKKTTTAAKKHTVPDTVIYAGTYSLEAGTTYTLGGALKLEGDTTEYAQGIQFQVKAGGSFTFR